LLTSFAQKRCFLTIPSFLSEGQLTAHEGMQSQTIVSVCIRVENAIKRLKVYKVLSETLSNPHTAALQWGRDHESDAIHTTDWFPG